MNSLNPLPVSDSTPILQNENPREAHNSFSPKSRKKLLVFAFVGISIIVAGGVIWGSTFLNKQRTQTQSKASTERGVYTGILKKTVESRCDNTDGLICYKIIIEENGVEKRIFTTPDGKNVKAEDLDKLIGQNVRARGLDNLNYTTKSGRSLKYFLVRNITSGKFGNTGMSGNAGTEFGFDAHIRLSQDPPGLPGIISGVERIKRNIDELTANKQQWIRFNLLSSDFNLQNWDERKQYVIDVIDYAKSKGLKVMLVTDYYPRNKSDNKVAQDAPISCFIDGWKNYMERLGNDLNGKVDLWQIYNEADTHNFRNYSTIVGSAPASLPLYSTYEDYLNDFEKIMEVSSQTLKRINPANKITHNSSGGVSDDWVALWFDFWDRMAKHSDIISLDLYPENTDDLNLLWKKIRQMRERYDKPVAIAETGTCSLAPHRSEQKQKDLLLQYITHAKMGNPSMLLLYEIHDEMDKEKIAGREAISCVKTYGIKYFDHTKKAAFDDVMKLMQTNPTIPTPTLYPSPILTRYPAPAQDSAAPPKGRLVFGDCNVIVGWTCDPSNFNKALKVNFYDASTNQKIGSTVADRVEGGLGGLADKQDIIINNNLTPQCAGNRYHAYKIKTPDSLKNGKEITIVAKAEDVPNGTEYQLGGKVKINCPAPTPLPACPQGSY